MVVAGKIFRLVEPLSVGEVAVKLDGYRTEEPYEEGDYNFALVTEVVGLLPKENTLSGVYSHDYVMHVFHRGKTAPLPRTVEALFSFAQLEDTTFLTIVEKKRVANFIANKLSGILFDKVGGIVEARIPPETLREFHLKNPEDTKITFFDNVDVPNVNKLSLYGPDLVNATLFEDYTIIFYFRFLNSFVPSISVTYSNPVSNSLHASSKFSATLTWKSSLLLLW
jgi:hypothetical protein